MAFAVRVSRIYKTLTRPSDLVKKIQGFKIPEKLKGGRIERFGYYWKGIYQDYRDVAVETYTDMKDHPTKAALILTGLTTAFVAMKSKPDEQSFFTAVVKNSNNLLLLSDSIRNTDSNSHIKYLMHCYNKGLIRHFNFGLVSFIWVDNFDKSCDLYQAQCKYLKPEIISFYKRIVDVGFMGKWLVMDLKMKNFDVNEDEWK